MEYLAKINEFIKNLEQIKVNGINSEDERRLLSGRIKGFINGILGNEKGEEYNKHINKNISFYASNDEIFEEQCKRMKEYLTLAKEEIETTDLFKKTDTRTFENLKENVEKNKLESERRKNVAEFKYWGFAIELIDTVRK